MKEINRKPIPRYTIVDGQRVLEPPEATAARQAKLDERLPWDEDYFRGSNRPNRTPIAGAMEQGETT